LHPSLEAPHVPWRVHVGHRHLMRPPVALALLAVDLLRAGPALRRTEHDHRPGWPLRGALRPRVELDLLDVGHDRVGRGGQLLMYLPGLVAFHEVRRVPIAHEEALQLVPRDPGEEAWIGDLVAVQVEDRQHRAVTRRVQELVRVPPRRERTGLRLTVADDAG